jgi:polar amino acid transport system substrate-binding protein
VDFSAGLAAARAPWLRSLAPALLLFVFNPLSAPAAVASPAPHALTVGLFLTDAPFVNRTKAGYTGYAFDLWQKIAEREKWLCTYVVYPTHEKGLDALETHRIDAFVSNVSITSDRMQRVSFSQPFFNAGVQIMLDSKQERAANDLWHGLVASGHVRVYAAGAVLVLIVALLVLPLERRFNDEFPREWGLGLVTSIHNVCSLLLTGKANHKGLPGAAGKLLAIFWMFAGVASIAYITSSVTSVMTANAINGSITGPADLAHKRVATKAGSAAESSVRALNLDLTAYPDLGPAVDALVKSQVRAVLWDFPTLRWYVKAHPELPLEIVGQPFAMHAYGFATRAASPLTKSIDFELLRLQEAGYTDELKTRYFGDN